MNPPLGLLNLPSQSFLFFFYLSSNCFPFILLLSFHSSKKTMQSSSNIYSLLPSHPLLFSLPLVSLSHSNTSVPSTKLLFRPLLALFSLLSPVLVDFLSFLLPSFTSFCHALFPSSDFLSVLHSVPTLDSVSAFCCHLFSISVKDQNVNNVLRYDKYPLRNSHSSFSLSDWQIQFLPSRPLLHLCPSFFPRLSSHINHPQANLFLTLHLHFTLACDWQAVNVSTHALSSDSSEIQRGRKRVVSGQWCHLWAGLMWSECHLRSLSGTLRRFLFQFHRVCLCFRLDRLSWSIPCDVAKYPTSTYSI